MRTGRRAHRSVRPRRDPESAMRIPFLPWPRDVNVGLEYSASEDRSDAALRGPRAVALSELSQSFVKMRDENTNSSMAERPWSEIRLRVHYSPGGP